MIANIFVIGLLNGCVYALLAAGFSLLFSVARIVNLAYTAFWMVAAYIFSVSRYWDCIRFWRRSFPLRPPLV